MGLGGEGVIGCSGITAILFGDFWTFGASWDVLMGAVRCGL